MEAGDRPHRSTSGINRSSSSSSSSAGNTSELFICFTASRLSSSSSSMKISSKSILSPGRAAREAPQISLSNSLSRRLRSSGSIKGGASPMFPTTNGKKRGVGFENPEPSSPKVTCIGQVRVKTKKQGKKIRARSSSRRGSGEVSFRKVEQNGSRSANNLEGSSSNGNTLQDYNSNNNNSSSSSSSNHMNVSSHQLLNQYQQQQQQHQDGGLQHRNQRWVHLPMTICEALRAFGAEFNCFLPCKSPCTANEKDNKEEKATGSSNGSSCGAVFARWLVAVQEGDGKGRDIELVVGGEEEEEEGGGRVTEEDITAERRRSYRRHIFDEIEFKDDAKLEGGGKGNEEEEEARVSICIPPKNALLLMRCRSDPVRMAALANKFWEAPVPREGDDEDEDRNNNDDDQDNEDERNEHVEEGRGEKDTLIGGASEEEEGKLKQEMKEKEEEEGESPTMVDNSVCCGSTEEEHGDEIQETKTGLVVVLLEEEVREETGSNGEIVCVHGSNLANQEEEAANQQQQPPVLEPATSSAVDPESFNDHETANKPAQENEDNNQEHGLQAEQQQQEGQAANAADDIRNEEISSQSIPHHQEEEEEEEEEECKLLGHIFQVEEEEEIIELPQTGAAEVEATELVQALSQEAKEREDAAEEDKTGRHVGSATECQGTRKRILTTDFKSKERAEAHQPLLPDCLLLMMCEPKLSMEVSKETWVCNTDFIRWLPEHSRPVNKKKDAGDEPKKRVPVDKNPPKMQNDSFKRQKHPPQPPPPPPQPQRSSCSYPARESMATMIEQKLVGANGGDYEPFVLTRCKSEPMRTAAKLAPEACFWKNRKHEPHRPPTVGVSAAGIGF